MWGIKPNCPTVFVLGIILGIALCEAYYILFSPTILAEGSVEVVTDREYFDDALQALQGARESIHMVMFSLNRYTAPEHMNSQVNQLITEVLKAKNKGVDVKIIMDDWPEGNEKSKGFFEENDIEVRVDEEFEGTTHDKLIIIDGKIVIVGSTNWSFFSVEKNHEANVIIFDERIARKFEEYFSSLWN